MSSPSAPVVSIFYLTYNQAQFVPESLPTVVGQSFTNWELIVVDDGSSDGALDVAVGWLSERGVHHRVVAHRQNLGLCRSLNDALAVAAGRYVAMIAADDWWELDKLADQVALLEQHEDAAVAYSDVYMNDADGKRLPGELWGTEPITGDVFTYVLGGGAIGPVAALLRRSAIDEVGGYDEALYFEDWDMWLRLAARYPFVHSEYVSASYRVQPASMSVRSDSRQRMLESSVALLEKWAGHDPATDDLVAGSLARVGWKLYAIDRAAGARVLRRSALLAPARRRFAQATWASLHLPPEGLARVLRLRRSTRRGRR